MKKVVVFGNNVIAEMLYYDAKKNYPEFKIAAFTVDESYLNDNMFCNLPMVSFSQVNKLYPSSEYDMISTVDAPTRLRSRMEVFRRIKEAGYDLRNYVSPLSDSGSNIIMGESNLIFAFAHVGRGGSLGDANFIRQNVYIGHDFKIGCGNHIAAGVTIAGCCSIGDSCFIGVGATVRDHVNIADETLVGAGTVITKDTEKHSKYVGNPGKQIGNHMETGIMMNPHGN